MFRRGSVWHPSRAPERWHPRSKMRPLLSCIRWRGGVDGKGWEFGREPHRSDIYSVIEKIPEVDHIRALTVQSTEDFPGSRGTGRFLVYSGTHSIKLVFEP